mmetsp:Transcript_52552/g.83401  ORF Transcript_52552/g.83401 Transcript_52552/m.83401 type:complete len:192 (+) Transcript_52552:3-578(+)
MTSEAGQALNGKFCKLVQQDPGTKRWTVELMDDDSKKALKEENLECSSDIDSDYWARKAAYLRENPDALKKMMSQQNQSTSRPLGKSTTWAKVKGIHPGAVVRLKGLTGAAELNGRKGRCISFDPESGRWKVDLGDVHKNIKPENMTPAPGEKPPTKQSAEAEIKNLRSNEDRREALTQQERAAEDYGWEG